MACTFDYGYTKVRDLYAVARFGLHVGTVQATVRDFAADPDLSQFFTATRPGRKASPKRERIRERAATLRRDGRTLGQIHQQLGTEGHQVSESYLATILREEGRSDRLEFP